MNDKMKLWQIGLIVIFGGACVNGLFVNMGVGGLLREAMRLVIFVGLGIFIFGLVRSFQKK